MVEESEVDEVVVVVFLHRNGKTGVDALEREADAKPSEVLLRA